MILKKKVKELKFWFDSISMVHKIIMFLLGLVGVGLMGNWYQTSQGQVKIIEVPVLVPELVEVPKYYPKTEIREVPKPYPVPSKPEIIYVDKGGDCKDHEKRLHNVR